MTSYRPDGSWGCEEADDSMGTAPRPERHDDLRVSSDANELPSVAKARAVPLLKHALEVVAMSVQTDVRLVWHMN